MTKISGLRRTALGSAAVLLLGALSACGSSDDASSSKTLTMWTFKQSQVEALKAVGAAWTEESGIPLEVTAYTPDDAYATKVQSAAKTDSLPDVISAHSQGEEWRFAQAGILRDLTDSYGALEPDNFLAGVAQASLPSQAAIDGSGDDPETTLKDLTADHVYGVPYLAGSPGVIYVRKSTLEAIGLSEVPQTWEEWIEAITKTKELDGDNGGVVTGLQVPETGHFWLYRPMSYKFLGPDKFLSRYAEGNSDEWTDPDNVNTLELYEQLSPLWQPGVLNLGIDDADQAFADGKSAWDVGGTFTLATLKANGISGDEVATFAVPAPEGSTSPDTTFQAAPLISAGVAASSEMPDEAVDFIKFLTSPEGAKIFGDTASDVPATNVPSTDFENPLVTEMTSLLSSADATDSVNLNDFSSEPPGGTTPSDVAKELANLPAGTKSVDQVAEDIAKLYSAAWSAS